MRNLKSSRGRVGIYAGTFDPPTVGHLWMIEQAAKLFDDLIVALGVSPKKHSTFSVAERLDMLRVCTARLKNTRIEQFTNEYLISYARRQKAAYMVRGIRSATDYEYERAMRHINGDLNPAITTVFLMPPRDIAEVSSNMVKRLIGPNGWETMVAPYLPPHVHRQVLKKYNAPLRKMRVG